MAIEIGRAMSRRDNAGDKPSGGSTSDCFTTPGGKITGVPAVTTTSLNSACG